MPRFQPLPLLSLFSLAGLALLITLGNWQVSRMAWKQGLVDAYEGRGEAASLAEAYCGYDGEAYSPGFAMPAPLAGEELRLYALRDVPGVVRIGVIPAPDCGSGEERYLLVESGFERQVDGTVQRPARWRLEPLPRSGVFTPVNDPDTNQWYGFDPSEMAQALSVPPARMMEMWARSDEGMPATLAQTPPAQHMGYALTWYGLALALIGVYLALHIAQGRLRWR
ncbi:MAG: SURF1 family protein [Alphaproteobacteria bacterium]|nr:SURF1 family protein [Alphaproteobacteria bacterium]